ncbi:hypothetical protein [Thorsellia kenyensis]|uniref:Uncharacterized protein n=1 Tax=Thorsellia kenyensis TaxID=1549888 RepID=A0ABV6CBC1_9GAMM
MDLNRFKDFLPITTILLVAFYVLTFFVKLGEMFYFGYPFSLLKFSFTDALLYSVRTLPLIIFCLVAGLLIDCTLLRYKKPKKALFNLAYIMFFSAFLFIFILLLFNNIMTIKQIMWLINYYQIMHWVIMGIIVNGFVYLLLPMSENYEKNMVLALNGWFAINFILIVILMYLPIGHIIFTIFVSFSITLNVLKNIQFICERGFIKKKLHNRTIYRINVYSYATMLLLAPMTASFFYGFIFYQIPFTSFTKLNDGGIVASHYDGSHIVRYCENKKAAFKIINPINSNDLIFSKIPLSYAEKVTLIKCK